MSHNVPFRAFSMSNFRLDFLRGQLLKSCSRNRAVKLIVFLWPLQGSISLVVSNNQVFSKQLGSLQEKSSDMASISFMIFQKF